MHFISYTIIRLPCSYDSRSLVRYDGPGRLSSAPQNYCCCCFCCCDGAATSVDASEAGQFQLTSART